jgi:hypothetical protein
MAGGRRDLDSVGMPIPPNLSQRELVKLALLVCSDRGSAKDRPAAKGVQTSSVKSRDVTSR